MNSNNQFSSLFYISKVRKSFSLCASLNIYSYLILSVILLPSYSVLWAPPLLQTIIFLTCNNLIITINNLSTSLITSPFLIHLWLGETTQIPMQNHMWDISPL